MANTTTSQDEPTHYLALPCPADKFAEFMAGLLGKPQEINRSFVGTFKIDISDIENFYYLIEQRVHEQNKASLVQFVVSVHYTDGSSVRIGDLDDLRSYAEVRPLIVRGVSLSWVYLVQFLNKEIPEKQQIDIEIRVKKDIEARLNGDIVRARSEFISVQIPDGVGPHTGVINISIRHTARSWGVDLENLLISHISNFLVTRDTKLRNLARGNATLLGFISYCMALSFLFSAGYRAMSYWTETIAKTYDKIKEGEPTGIIQKQIDFIAHTLVGGRPAQFAIVGMIGTILLFLVASPAWFAISEMASEPEPSFILLSRASEKHMDCVIREKKTSWKVLYLWLAVNAFAGVVGNIIFTLLWPFH